MYSFAMGPRGAVITLSGPVSLFRQTLRYGRALAGLLPAIAAVPNWSLEAKCLMGARMARFQAGAADPIVVAAPKDIDNRVERRLYADFRRLGSHWSIAHATQPRRATGFTLFPDFMFERGMDRVLIEIIGFHTTAYLQARREALRNAGLSSVLLCVDDALACSERGGLVASDIFHFQRRIEVGRLLRAIEHLSASRDLEPDSDQPSS
jgi:predicted nuclease of restriction endonuclease-like RecB superfamily